MKLQSLILGTEDPKKLIDFYTNVFGKKPDWSDGGWSGWQTGETHFMIGEHSEVTSTSKEPQRILINFEINNVQKEFDRIQKLGGKVVKDPYEMGGSVIATFADPDGNFFQLMSPWKG